MKFNARRIVSFDPAKNVSKEFAQLDIFVNKDEEWLTVAQMLADAQKLIEKLPKKERRIAIQCLISSSDEKPSVPVLSSLERAKIEDVKVKDKLEAEMKQIKTTLKSVPKKTLSKEEKHENEVEREALQARLKVLEAKLV